MKKLTLYTFLVLMFFPPNNLYAWEKAPVPDYVDKKTKSPWNFYDDFEDQKLDQITNNKILVGLWWWWGYISIKTNLPTFAWAPLIFPTTHLFVGLLFSRPCTQMCSLLGKSFSGPPGAPHAT